MKIEIASSNGEKYPYRLPEPEAIEAEKAHVVSLPVPGRIYETRRVFLPNGSSFAVKTLRESIIGEDGFGMYKGDPSLVPVFEGHIKEHALFVKHLGEFVLPTTFYQVRQGEKTFYKTLQPWIEGVQFRDAIKNNLVIPSWQMPDLLSRVRFLTGVAELHTDPDPVVQGKIQDLDFFIEDRITRFFIRIQDTNYFWYPKLRIDTRGLSTDLPCFLFNEDEREIDFVQEAVEKLRQSLPDLRL